MMLDSEQSPKIELTNQMTNQSNDWEFYKKLEDEYRPNMEDSDEIREVKEKIFSLPEFKRRIMILWIDKQSYSGVARIMKCSAPTISKYIKKLRKEIDL